MAVTLGEASLDPLGEVGREPVEVAQPDGQAQTLLTVRTRPQLLIPREEAPRRLEREERGGHAVVRGRLESLVVLLLHGPLLRGMGLQAVSS
eukprot:scaffold106102_cov45-Phaeocystis_antarctica.AAC.1